MKTREVTVMSVFSLCRRGEEGDWIDVFSNINSMDCRRAGEVEGGRLRRLARGGEAKVNGISDKLIKLKD